MIDIYIVIKDYNETLAKRQPWYTIQKLISDLEYEKQKVKVISALSDIPINFTGKVIKAFSLKDVYQKKTFSYELIYLMTFPVYSFKKIFFFPKNVLFENWQDLKRIFLFSLVPKFIVKKSLARASMIITISDRSDKYISQFTQTMKYYPFINDNWGSYKKDISALSKQKTLGYFGPPFTTRCFDEVMNFFMWLETENLEYKKKVITRIERDELKVMADKHLSKFKNNPSFSIVSGFLSRKELARHLCDIDILILPFRIVMSELPVVVLEALELNIPIITTKDSGIEILTRGMKNILMLEEFSQDSYNEVIDFINHAELESFDKVQDIITKTNSYALENICLK